MVPVNPKVCPKTVKFEIVAVPLKVPSLLIVTLSEIWAEVPEGSGIDPVTAIVRAEFEYSKTNELRVAPPGSCKNGNPDGAVRAA